MSPPKPLAVLLVACWAMGCQGATSGAVETVTENSTSPASPGQGGSAHSSERAAGGPAEKGPIPAVRQWFACQCGGPCEGAEAPLVNIRPSCHPQRGSTVGDRYEPCGGLLCGSPCALKDPGADPAAPSSTLCNAKGRCVPAAQATCL
jgi:hypothetical protein